MPVSACTPERSRATNSFENPTRSEVISAMRFFPLSSTRQSANRGSWMPVLLRITVG